MGRAPSPDMPFECPKASASESPNSRALWKRAAGSRCDAFSHQRSNVGGRSETYCHGIGTGATMMRTSRSPSASLSNGSLPVRAWKTMTASDQRSLRASTALMPCACSGLM